MIYMFDIDDLLRVAKRENNTKRCYLYVNPLQGKHVPVSPSLSMAVFAELAAKVEARYASERLLVVGFAETATAIGASMAMLAKNARYHLNTSREDVPHTEYLFFTESHSHATEQRLATAGLEAALNNVDRVVFAEDEVTTGNTIEKIMRILQNRYAHKSLRFGIASILNSMSPERQCELEDAEIPCDYLHKIPQRFRVDEVNRHTYAPLLQTPSYDMGVSVAYKEFHGYWNCRLATDVETMRVRTQHFVESSLDALDGLDTAHDVLILGTEEFMFPGMQLGCKIENAWPRKNVRFHATTRSPIEVSHDEGYPLQMRQPLESLYEKGRRTFVYNLAKYDKAIIITDANPINQAGLQSLVGGLEAFGNTDITLIQWKDSTVEE